MVLENNISSKKNEKYLRGNNKITKIIIVLILSLNIPFIIKLKNNDKNININISIVGNHSINSKDLRYFFFTILLEFNNSQMDQESLTNLIKKILDQTFKEIQIIVLYNSKNNTLKDLIKQKTSNINNVEIYPLNEKFFVNYGIDLINEIKGKFSVFVDKFMDIKNDDFLKIYYMTKGNINNIFRYSIKKNIYLYIIRTKTLRDIFDIKNKFYNINDIIIFLYSYPLPKLNYIPVAYCPDNSYTALTYTSMISVLSSRGYYSYILFFIVIQKNFKQNNIHFLETLYEQYDYFNITFIKMDEKYKNAFTARYLTINAYFRYSLGELIPNLDKIIYLDSDTICLTDLSKFINLNFRGKVILGRIINSIKEGEKKYISINTGILLLNLKEMRQMKFEKMILNILKNKFGTKEKIQSKEYNVGTDILTVDQALINIYFHKYIGSFPPKYNVFYHDHKRVSKVNNYYGNIYENDTLHFYLKFPSIRHYPGENKNIVINMEEWLVFAKKSKYFHKNKKNLSDIYNYSFNFFY